MSYDVLKGVLLSYGGEFHQNPLEMRRRGREHQLERSFCTGKHSQHLRQYVASTSGCIYLLF